MHVLRNLGGCSFVGAGVGGCLIAGIAGFLTIGSLGADSGAVWAQSIAPAADGTGTVVTPQGDRLDISGGSRSSDGANLFHSFERFNLNTQEIANFLATPDLRNILGRVVGGDPSRIDGLIQVSGGNPNLFLVNPAGLVFGPNARLNVPASFTATTATGVSFGESGEFWFQATGANQYANLLGDPTGLAFALSQPAGILNRAALAVPTGQSLSLVGGTVLSVGTLSAPGGRLMVAAVPGDRFVRFTPEGSVLALDLPIGGRPGADLALGPIAPRTIPELLAGQPVTANALTVRPDGTVSIGHSEGPLAAGDVAVQSATAGTATLSAAHNLLLLSSQLSTTGDLHLLAGQAAIGRDNPTNPLRLSAGGQLTLWGDRQVDLYGLHHPDSGIISDHDLFLVSSGAIAGNLPLRTGGQLFVTQPTGDRVLFRTVFEPIFSDRDGQTTLAFGSTPARSNRAPFISSPVVATTTTRPTTPSPSSTSSSSSTSTGSTTLRPIVPLNPTGTGTTGTSTGTTGTINPGSITLIPGTTNDPPSTNPTLSSSVSLIPVAPMQTGSNSSTTNTTVSGLNTSFSLIPIAPVDSTTTNSTNSEDEDDRSAFLPVKPIVVNNNSNTANTGNTGPSFTVATVNISLDGANFGGLLTPTNQGIHFSTGKAPISAPWAANVDGLVQSTLANTTEQPVSAGGSSPVAGTANAGNTNLIGNNLSAAISSDSIVQRANLASAAFAANPASVNGVAGNAAPVTGAVPTSTNLSIAPSSGQSPNAAPLVPPSGITDAANNSMVGTLATGLPVSSNPLPNSGAIGEGGSNLAHSAGVVNSQANQAINQTALLGSRSPGLESTNPSGIPANGPVTDPGQVLNLQALRAETLQVALCDNTVWLDCQRKDLERARNSGDRKAIVVALQRLGRAHYQAGEYGDAILAHRESRDLATDQPLLAAIAESDLGSSYGALGQYPEAIAHYEQALALLRSNPAPTLESNILNNLGLMATNQQNLEQARAYFAQSLAIAQQHQDLSNQARALTQIGLLDYQATRYEAAVKAHQASLALAEQANDQPAIARTLDNLGLAYYAQGDYGTAATVQQKALALAQALGDRHGTARALSNLGDTYYRLQDFDAATDYLQRAIASWEQVRENLTSDGARLAIFETQETTYSTLQTVLIAAQKPEQALLANERGRAQALLKLLAEESQWGDRSAAQSAPTPNPSELTDSIDLGQIQRVAREQSATLISYAIERDTRDHEGQRQLLDLAINIWVVQPSGQVHFRQVPLPNSQTLRDQIPLLRLFLGTRTASRSAQSTVNGNRRSITPGLRQLHRLLIEPIAEWLPTQPGDRLIVMPQQDLFLVPFSALQDDQGRYLIERHSLAMAPSIQVLDRTQRQAQRLRQ
ncbi:MAG: tetratricopeptide repeat protein, partial [Limnothrix sp.]|nr:tetratricopeptide repeat protein [Limnothrix sp.]